MPDPFKAAQVPPHVMDRFKQMFPQHGSADPMLQAINGLREDIAALRRDLAPVPSAILMGREVLEEFRSLRELEGRKG